jgi:hypothetical protein
MGQGSAAPDDHVDEDEMVKKPKAVGSKWNVLGVERPGSREETAGKGQDLVPGGADTHALGEVRLLDPRNVTTRECSMAHMMRRETTANAMIKEGHFDLRQSSGSRRAGNVQTAAPRSDTPLL